MQSPNKVCVMKLFVRFQTLMIATSFLSAAAFAGGMPEEAASATQSDAAGGQTHVVEMHKFKYVPDSLTVKVGDTVRWLNVEKRQYHSVWFREAGDDQSVYLFPEETFQKTFDKPGVYPYVCGPHETSHDMMGVITVVE